MSLFYIKYNPPTARTLVTWQCIIKGLYYHCLQLVIPTSGWHTTRKRHACWSVVGLCILGCSACLHILNGSMFWKRLCTESVRVLKSIKFWKCLSTENDHVPRAFTFYKCLWTDTDHKLRGFLCEYKFIVTV